MMFVKFPVLRPLISMTLQVIITITAGVDISDIDYTIRTNRFDFITCTMMNRDKQQKINLALKMFRHFT